MSERTSVLPCNTPGQGEGLCRHLEAGLQILACDIRVFETEIFWDSVGQWYRVEIVSCICIAFQQLLLQCAQPGRSLPGTGRPAVRVLGGLVLVAAP